MTARGKNLSVSETAVGLDLNGNGALKIEYDANWSSRDQWLLWHLC